MRRPLGLTIVGFLQTLLGGVFLMLTIFLMALSYVSISSQELLSDLIGGLDLPPILLMHLTLIIFSLSIILMVTGIGILLGFRWIYYVEVLLLISLLLNIISISIPNPTNIVLVIIPIVLLVYFNGENVRSYFFSDVNEGEYFNFY